MWLVCDCLLVLWLAKIYFGFCLTTQLQGGSNIYTKSSENYGGDVNDTGLLRSFQWKMFATSVTFSCPVCSTLKFVFHSIKWHFFVKCDWIVWRERFFDGILPVLSFVYHLPKESTDGFFHVHGDRRQLKNILAKQMMQRLFKNKPLA